MTLQQPLFAVILAAGKGTRMKSDRAKVLHEIFFAPMIVHVLRTVQEVHPEKTVVIVGHQRQAVMQALTGFSLDFAIQEDQLGTGHAVLCAEEALHDKDGVVMILCGDTPLLKTETLLSMYQHHIDQASVLTIMTTVLENPTNYGRIICDENGKVMAIVEEKDASETQQRIKEINAGIYCVGQNFLFKTLKTVGTQNSQGEVYLTDIVSLAVTAGLPVEKFVNPCPQDILGVNSRVELAQAHKEIQRRRNHQLMLDGVTLHDPETTAVSQSVCIGRDTVLQSGVRITGNGAIGASCLIEAGALLHDCSLGDEVVIGAYSYLDGITCPAKSVIAPHSIRRNDHSPKV
jgi:bifunctional UDP-N-acetylglucosamine pyrophosphorylase / glucosamine-1-phosphate N-acetyltransferase